jgi:hypothetical protein
VAACHGGTRPDLTARPAATTVDKVWLLEASGTAVRDTSVTFAAAAGRTIMLRHAEPDDAIFAVLTFPATKDSLRSRDSVHVMIHPLPGHYAFALATSDKLGPGAQATFYYAMHFQTPSDAVSKYPSPGRFEAALAPATIGADNKVVFLVGNRPAADAIRLAVTAAGTYALAALR